MFKLKTKMSNPKFKIRGIAFIVSKLPPMQGFTLSEFIRVNLIRSANSFQIDDDAGEKENAALFFKAILGLEPDVVEHIREELFEFIEYQGNGVEKGYASLSGLEDMAFQDFEIVDVYQVLGRALAVNFIGSFSGIVSAFPGVEKVLKSHLQKM